MITPAKAREEHGRDTKGRWLKGQSGNPSGTATGSRHRATLDAEQLMNGNGQAITQRCVELALAGDSTALKLCVERLIPVKREMPIEVALPSLTGNDAPDLAQVIEAERRIIGAVAAGELLPGEAHQLMAVLRSHRDSIIEAQGADELREVGPINFVFEETPDANG